MKELKNYKDSDEKELNTVAVKRLKEIIEPLSFHEATEVLFAEVSRKLEEMEARILELEDLTKPKNELENGNIK